MNLGFEHALILFIGVIITLLGCMIREKFFLAKKFKKAKNASIPSTPGNGNLTKIRALHTQLNSKELALLKANAKFEVLFHSAPIMIGSFDANGIPDLWNKECENIFGYTSEEIIGNPNALSLFYGKDADLVYDTIKKAEDSQ